MQERVIGPQMRRLRSPLYSAALIGSVSSSNALRKD